MDFILSCRFLEVFLIFGFSFILCCFFFMFSFSYFRVFEYVFRFVWKVFFFFDIFLEVLDICFIVLFRIVFGGGIFLLVYFGGRCGGLGRDEVVVIVRWDRG